MFPFATKRARMTNITARELQEQLAGGRKPTILDVREPWEYQEGHIPGSKLHPLAQIRSWSQKLNKQDEVVLVCRSGARSAGAYEFLEQQGFTNLKNLIGGMITWRGPVE